jgi:hypothetical protein
VARAILAAVPDLIFHVGIYLVLIIGLIVAAHGDRIGRSTGGA